MNTQEAIEILSEEIGWQKNAYVKEALTHAIEHMKRGAPEGWQLVPKEPTTEILKAMYDCDDEAPWADLWDAALKAAPEPPREYLKHSEGGVG